IQVVGGSTTVTGIKVQVSSESVESINAFTLANRGLSQYAALLLALLLSAISVYAIVLCILAKIGRQRWIWLLLILINIGHASVNWTTGQWSFTPLSIHYGIPPTPANMSCSAYGPWMVDLSLPLGALVFLAYLRRRTSRAKVAAGRLRTQAGCTHNNRGSITNSFGSNPVAFGRYPAGQFHAASTAISSSFTKCNWMSLGIAAGSSKWRLVASSTLWRNSCQVSASVKIACPSARAT